MPIFITIAVIISIVLILYGCYMKLWEIEHKKVAKRKEEEYKQRKELFLCCGNCQNFNWDEHLEKPEVKSLCEYLLWTYNINYTTKFWFCSKFRVASRFGDTHRIDMKSRDKTATKEDCWDMALGKVQKCNDLSKLPS